MPARLVPYCLLILSFLLLPLLPAHAQSPASQDELLVETADAVWTAVGNSVLRLDPDSGEVLLRKAVGGQVTLLEEANGGVSVVSSFPGGVTERISLQADGRASSTIRFTTDAEVLHSLRDEAAAVADPLEELERDAANPWLNLFASRVEPARAEEYREAALEGATTFYDLAGLAVEFAADGDIALAHMAMQRALRDFAARGYAPELLNDLELHAAYGFPLPHLQRAMAADEPAQAAFFAHWLEAFLHPGAAEIRAALSDYATWLAGRGEVSEARALSERLRPDSAVLAVSGAERLFASVGRSGWYMLASIITVILALQVTLTLKYWEPQGLAMRRALETGGRASFMQRFLAIRFFSTTEKLVLALLYATGLAVLGLTAWAGRPGTVPEVVGAGTVAGPEAVDRLDDLQLSGERGQFIRGYLAQVQGLSGAAELHYRAAPRYGPALNNLAVLQDDAELFEAARIHAPALPEIAWNLGDADAQPHFDRIAGLDRPALVVPSPADFRAALLGSWQQAASGFFTAPVEAFTMNVPWLSAQWVWYVLLGLYLLLGTLTLLWILVPRPRMARNAPRSVGYHLLALLVPGSGMADEVWGIMLLVPWGMFGIDLLWRYVGSGPLLDVSLTTTVITLLILYAVNTAAFTIEFAAYSRRMRQLFDRNPEAGIAYGKRIEAH